LNFSTPQWLSSIVLDVVIKFVFVTAIGVFVSYGLMPIDTFVMPAVALSLLHFVCLFLGMTAVVMLELLHVRLSPILKFAARVAVANVLFVGVLVGLLWPGPNDIPRTMEGPFVVALVFATTNLVTLLTVVAAGRLIGQFKRRVHAIQSERGS
jgi:hypothetical protein